ncbi:hypothetical protein [Azovibrio restrictus]|nr:hypothetical protein [Azovibrio restrictus]MDD3483125.1 hypothetical protein [Azovibrio restrictus]
MAASFAFRGTEDYREDLAAFLEKTPAPPPQQVESSLRLSRLERA